MTLPQLARFAIITFIAIFRVSPAAAERVLTFGDSLSKEYYLEFAIEFQFQGYPDAVQSWTEILDAYRKSEFEYGEETGFPHPQIIFGHEYNWSIPGGKMGDFVAIVRGTASTDRTSRDQIRAQLQGEVDRFVLFVGGNDADSVYGTAYNTGNLATFSDRFVAETTEVLDWVMAQNPALELVLVNVPHVGATPKVKGEYPPDPIKTTQATIAYASLNARLAGLAAARGIGYADVFGLTERFLDTATVCYQGVEFINDSARDGDLDYLWLDGPAADEFHPNGNGQALVANLILEAFNEAYASAIPPLTAREILDGHLGMEADMPFADWLACYGIAGSPAGTDDDGDGATNDLEFGLGLDPTWPDAPGSVTSAVVDDGGSPAVEIRFRQRLGTSTKVTVLAEQSDGLGTWTPVTPGDLPDGRRAARLPIVPASPGFLRLRAVLVD